MVNDWLTGAYLLASTVSIAAILFALAPWLGLAGKVTKPTTATNGTTIALFGGQRSGVGGQERQFRVG